MAEEEDKESLARAQLPYRAEYCKTSRAKCKKCTEPMEAKSLKLAIMVKSRWHDGYDANYYHVPCFFQIKRPASVAEIRHFETLKFDDQKMLEKAVETNGRSVLGTAVPVDAGKPSAKSKSKKRAQPEPSGSSNGEVSVLVNYDDFSIEYAKSGRAKCVVCEEKIEKDAVRISKLDYDADTPWQGGPVPRWHHVECFAKAQQKLEFFGQVEKIKDFKLLEKEDQKMVKKIVKPIKPEIPDESKKPKKDPETASKEEAEEKLLKKQSRRFFNLREHVDAMKRKDIELMLEHMEQKSFFRNPSALVDHATDILMFGPMERCPECKRTDGMVLRGSSYICTNGSDENPCSYEVREPKRGVPDIPEDIVEKYDFFNNGYKFRGGHRIFPSKFVKAVEQKEAEDNNIVQDGAPLEGITIGMISWKSIDFEKSKVQKKITTLGGKLTVALGKSVFVILSNEDELSKDTPKVEVAKALEIPFAKADFLFKIEKKEDVVPEVKKCLIGDTKFDLAARYKQVKVEISEDLNSSAETIEDSQYGSEVKPEVVDLD